MADSPLEIITSSKPKKGNKGLIIGIIIVVFLALSVVAGVLLVRQRQSVQEKAATSAFCPDAQACPYDKDPTLLRSCDTVEADQTPQDSNCDTSGETHICGGVSFCCPAPGQSWTTNMTVCNQLAATPTPTPDLLTDSNNCGNVGFACSNGTSCVNGACVLPTASPSPTTAALAGATAGPTATPRATGSPTPLPTLSTGVQTTPLPVPVTGVDWPTAAGIGVGAAAIILSIFLAL